MNKPVSSRHWKLDDIAVGAAQLQHPIQRRAAHQHLRRLPREASGTHAITKDGLEAKHRRLGQAASMITALPFPRRTPDLPNAPQVLIPCQALGLSIAVLPN